MARLWTLGHGDCLAGVSQGKAARLAEKAAGWRGQNRVSWEDKGKRAPSLAALGVWPALPHGEMVDGGAVLLRGRAAAETRDSPS